MEQLLQRDKLNKQMKMIMVKKMNAMESRSLTQHETVYDEMQISHLQV